MKTPKRDYFAYAEHDMYTTPGTANKLSTRWKRKNRIKQLKHTIARLAHENFLMKIDLHIPVNISYDEYHSRRVDFTEKKPETYFD